MSAGPVDPTPNLETLTSTEMLLEMGKVIQDSRKYFNDVCNGIGFQAEGELAYMYVFVLTRDKEPSFWDKVWSLGHCPPEFSHYIINDEHHQIWVPKNGDMVPYDWAWGINSAYTKLPIKNVQKHLSLQAEYIKKRLETARNNADGIANMQAEDFDAIGGIPTALGLQNGQLDELVLALSDAGREAQGLRERIEDIWVSESARRYSDRVGTFKNSVIELSEASVAMKNANIELAKAVGELLYAIMELWKARIEGLDEQASGILGGAKDLVSLLTKPTVLGVVETVLSMVFRVIEKMATQDVEDRMQKLRDLADMADKSKVLEEAKPAALQVDWPTIPDSVFRLCTQ